MTKTPGATSSVWNGWTRTLVACAGKAINRPINTRPRQRMRASYQMRAASLRPNNTWPDEKKNAAVISHRGVFTNGANSVSYTHLRAHETPEHLVCRLL